MINSHKYLTKKYGSILAEYSVFFRSISNEIEVNPNAIFNYIDHPALKALYNINTLDPENFFLLYEALSYGDINVLFAAPRTCLSGILLNLIGTEEQRNYYFDYLKNYHIRSFFAVTEPERGSDANNLKTCFESEIDDKNIFISGEKILVGNLGVANIGVIVGRISKSPLGIRSVLITPDDFIVNRNNFVRNTLPMFGIKSALLGQAEFSNFRIPASQILGINNHPIERGLFAIIKTFNIMRLGISAFALGHAQAIIDYIKFSKKLLSRSDKTKLIQWQSELNALRQIALLSAKANKNDSAKTAKISLVKVGATQLVEKIAINAIEFFGATCIVQHPYLVNSLKNCFGYEYMDGTSNVHRKNIYQGYLDEQIKFN